jgi:hypothetical protein
MQTLLLAVIVCGLWLSTGAAAWAAFVALDLRFEPINEVDSALADGLVEAPSS